MKHLHLHTCAAASCHNKTKIIFANHKGSKGAAIGKNASSALEIGFHERGSRHWVPKGYPQSYCLVEETITSNKTRNILGQEFDAKNLLVPKPKVSGDCLRVQFVKTMWVHLEREVELTGSLIYNKPALSKWRRFVLKHDENSWFLSLQISMIRVHDTSLPCLTRTIV